MYMHTYTHGMLLSHKNATCRNLDGEGNGTPLQYFAWKIPWMEDPGGLQSMGSLKVGHDWATSLSLFTFMHWRGKWHPTPVFLPGESQGRGNLVAAIYGVTQSRTRLKRLSSRNMDEPTVYHTKWSKSDRERQTYDITYSVQFSSVAITYMWNLKKKWYKWTYLQNRNRLTEIENKPMVTKRKRKGGINRKFRINNKCYYI